MRPLLVLLISFTCCATSVSLAEESPKSGCLKCHDGIESIREHGSKMLEEILERGAADGNPAGCIVCHGGDPRATEKEAAHGGAFYPDPGSPWINKHTCGQCHPDHVKVQWHSLMMTEAGKIQGVMWAFGSMTGYEHKYGNYAVENPKDPQARLGTETYRAYMERLKECEPQVFVDRHEALPDALVDLTDFQRFPEMLLLTAHLEFYAGLPAEVFLAEHEPLEGCPQDLRALSTNPELAAFTYIRNQCQRCHHAVKGRQTRGDYRGMGCSSCHIPYGNEGHYEGGDPAIDKTQTGHSLVHSIQGTREAKVTVHGKTYSGIPVETCTTCHDRGKRIGVSFQGLMETPYKSPYNADGGHQPDLHTKHYIAMHQDIHYQKGMTCQDCHTSIDVHSDGFLAACNLAAVQIECADCHGTPDKYPWELPIGFGDEMDPNFKPGLPRGTTDKLLKHVEDFGHKYPVKDGYLLTARGNPYGNVVRDGNEVIVHTAAGRDIRLKPLKMIQKQGDLSLRGQVSMAEIESHLETMECYSCHASWAPQCYGCHVKIDYSGGKTCFDWVGAGRRHQQEQCAADRGESDYDTIIPGKIEEQRSYLRWEEPMLGVNGEGRVTPLAPGCQPSVTVVGPDGTPVLLNKIFRTQADAEGGGEKGQLAIDMSPSQPHTMTKDARTCESCHTSPKALGYGIAAGTVRAWDERKYVELEAYTDGSFDERQILPKQTIPQMEPIDGLSHDWSQIVTEDGVQLQTVGHHLSQSRPLNNREREVMTRDGVCLSCHQEIPNESLAVSILHHIAEYTGQMPHSNDQHDKLVNKIVLTAAWVQVIGIFSVPLVVIFGCVWVYRKLRGKK